LTYYYVLLETFYFPEVFVGHGLGSLVDLSYFINNSVQINSLPSLFIGLFHQLGIVGLILISIPFIFWFKHILKFYKLNLSNKVLLDKNLYFLLPMTLIIFLQNFIQMNIFPSYLYFPIMFFVGTLTYSSLKVIK